MTPAQVRTLLEIIRFEAVFAASKHGRISGTTDRSEDVLIEIFCNDPTAAPDLMGEGEKLYYSTPWKLQPEGNVFNILDAKNARVMSLVSGNLAQQILRAVNGVEEIGDLEKQLHKAREDNTTLFEKNTRLTKELKTAVFINDNVSFELEKLRSGDRVKELQDQSNRLHVEGQAKSQRIIALSEEVRQKDEFVNTICRERDALIKERDKLAVAKEAIRRANNENYLEAQEKIAKLTTEKMRLRSMLSRVWSEGGGTSLMGFVDVLLKDIPL